MLDDVPYRTKLRFVKDAARAAPDNPATGVHMAELATTFTRDDDDDKRALCEFIMEHWSDEPHAAADARGLLKQLDRIGEPCAFEFDDLLSGERVDSVSLRGSPVLVMIWSGGIYETIESELKRLRDLRARAPKLPVVGIFNFRHQDGADALAAQLREHSVDWPHWYDEEEFSTPWGEGPFSTNRTPLYFVLDRAGVIRSVGYRLATVEAKLEELTRVRQV